MPDETPSRWQFWARRLERTTWFHRWWTGPWARRRAMRFPPVDPGVHDRIVEYADYHRFAGIAMAITRLQQEQVPGAFAECGVFQGHASRFIHGLAPDRTYYLFDTFAGFDQRDVEPGSGEDRRFRATSVEAVLRYIGDTRNLVVKQGRVPETFTGLDGERFAFVLLDMDVYPPTKAALEYFYPRLSPGGYLMVHDYHNDESNWACKRAVDEFMAGKPEGILDVADVWGSVVVRRLRSTPA